ncbi:MAG: ComF family protein [Oscillospiraceae bacterium]|nr:ComF family protein [Oscillospiraceae bacterium]
MKKSILNFFYPNRCPSCEKFLSSGETVCEVCAEDMLVEQDSYCHQCGKVTCFCDYKKLYYDKAVIACYYANATIPAILKLKLSKNTNFAYFSARILAQRLQSEEYGKLDMIIPVPMHSSKLRERGYNQASLIAKEIANFMHIPCREDILYKNKSVAQHQLNAEQRAKNITSFHVRDISLKNKHVLLCDDVLTTGNTLNYCAELLKQVGASRVTIASASTTVLKSKEEIFT